MVEDRIRVKKAQIDRTIKGLMESELSYLSIAERVENPAPLDTDADFRLACRRYFGIRRGAAWLDSFFDLMQGYRSSAHYLYPVIDDLYDLTGKYDPVMASYIVGTLNQERPFFTPALLSHLSRPLSSLKDPREKSREDSEQHDQVAFLLDDFLESEVGLYLVSRFDSNFPGTYIAAIKKAEMVLSVALV